MSPEQKRLLQQSYAVLLPIREQVAALFYGRLFELEPGLQALFSSDINLQGRKLMNTLYTVVYNLDRLDKVIPPVQALGQRHAGYGVQPEYYELVGTALLWALRQSLAEKFTPAVEEAWVTAYTVLATVMQEAASTHSLQAATE